MAALSDYGKKPRSVRWVALGLIAVTMAIVGAFYVPRYAMGLLWALGRRSSGVPPAFTISGDETAALPATGIYLSNTMDQPVVFDIEIETQRSGSRERVAMSDIMVAGESATSLTDWTPQGQIRIEFRAREQATDGKPGWAYRGVYTILDLAPSQTALIELVVHPVKPSPEVRLYEVGPLRHGWLRGDYRREHFIGPHTGMTIENRTNPPRRVKIANAELRDAGICATARDFAPRERWFVSVPPGVSPIGLVVLDAVYDDGTSDHIEWDEADSWGTIKIGDDFYKE